MFMTCTLLVHPLRRLFLTFPEDSSKSKEETVEVGVIVMGLCCICLVACALAVLHLRSSSRRISGNRRRAEHSEGVSEDRSLDPLDVAAPPSYDTGSMIFPRNM